MLLEKGVDRWDFSLVYALEAMINLAIKSGANPKDIYKHLIGLSDIHMFQGDGTKVKSLPDAIALFLKEQVGIKI